MEIASGIVARFRRQLAHGDVVLFTGAGFSMAAVAADGRAVAGVADLRREFTRLAFGSGASEDDSSLADLFELALSRAEGSVRTVFDSRLRVDGSRTPVRYADWFSMPWRRVYTLNVDDLETSIATAHPLPRAIESVSALNHSIVQTNDLLSVHINGRVSDFPHVTFGTRQYARRAGSPDPWYEMLTSDLLSSPVLFVGTTLDEQGLWQHIEMRGTRHGGDVELRPPSYLVSPSLPRARVGLLKRYNIDWVQATESDFWEQVIRGSDREAALGRQVIARLHHPSGSRDSIKPLASLRADAAGVDTRVFLQGREPVWEDVEEDGYAVIRSFESELGIRARAARNHLLLITGTAASGKSTTAMRLALSLSAEGRSVFAYDTADGSRSVDQVLRAARQARADVLLVDDVDLFGDSAGRLLHDLVAENRDLTVIATVRSSRLHGLTIERELEGISYSEDVVPLLEDGDIDLLVASLERAGSLGRMAGMTQEKRRELLREMAGRQLVVAMYYATSGELLQDRVRSECEDLSGASRLAYGMAALATAEHQYVRRNELLVGLGMLGHGNDGNHVLNELEKLSERHLLVDFKTGLQVRHRWIAEESLEFFAGNGLLHRIVGALAFALACETDAQTSRHTRERRMLRRLINHDRLLKTIGDLDACREVYESLQDRVGWDYHYWLQRGSLEVEKGDLGFAKQYLESARSLSEGRDRRVENEYAYLLLKKASCDPKSSGAAEDVDTAFGSLKEAMVAHGATDPYPYHVYGSQGLSWARRAELTAEARRTLVASLVEAVEEGRRHHPKRDDLRQLEQDLRREQLLLAASI